MQIVQIDFASLEGRINEMRSLKEAWETTHLEQIRPLSSGASAEALVRIMAEYEELRLSLIELMNLTLAVLENTAETFEETDDYIARIFKIGTVGNKVQTGNDNPPSVPGAGTVGAVAGAAFK